MKSFCENHPWARNMCLITFLALFGLIIAGVVTRSEEFLTWLMHDPLNRFLIAIALGATLLFIMGMMLFLGCDASAKEDGHYRADSCCGLRCISSKVLRPLGGKRA